MLNDLQTAGIIESYAVFGAIAQMRYTEPVVTFDLDVLVSLPPADHLDLLAGVYEFCARQGYHPAGEAIRVGAWPVQFLPVYNALTREALEYAETSQLEGVPLRVVRADYLAAIALATGRAKDHERILALLDSGAASRADLEELARRYGLDEAWKRFRTRLADG